MSIFLPPLSGRRFIFFLLPALLHFGWADEFTSPSNSNADLFNEYTLGETVQLSWNTSLSQITLLVSHWGGNTVGSLLSDAFNPNVYTWTIGQTDNVNNEQISQSPNFVLLIRDPSGTVGTGNGFVNNQLSSRAFIIKSNVTTSSSTTSSITTSTSSITTSASSITTSTSSMQQPITVTATAFPTHNPAPTSIPSTGLSTGAKVGIGAGCVLMALILLTLCTFFWRRKSNKKRLQQRPEVSTVHSTGGLYEASGPTPDLKKSSYFHQAPQVRYAQNSYGSAQAAPELPSSSPWNAGTTTTVYEIDGRGRDDES